MDLLDGPFNIKRIRGGHGLNPDRVLASEHACSNLDFPCLVPGFSRYALGSLELAEIETGRRHHRSSRVVVLTCYFSNRKRGNINTLLRGKSWITVKLIFHWCRQADMERQISEA
jgi:hypothetical protein